MQRALHWLLLSVLVLIIGWQRVDAVQLKPMILPIAEPPSPGTWMFGQAYGNTTGAYNFGDQWYRAGQGLHFGIDFAMPCGTPLVAVADGYVRFVSDMAFGSAPHNLILEHPEIGLTTLYGHLLEKPNLVPGQFIQQGQFVGLSGDPDITCDSRPHLHLEVRSLDYSRTVNPAAVMNANWHSLSLIGPYGYPLFQQDLDNPRRWVSMDDQPDVQFWGQILNRYQSTYPLAYDVRPAPSPIPAHTAPAIADTSQYTLRQITSGGCCAFPRWHPTDSDVFYTADGGSGERAGVYTWSATDATSVRTQPAPIPYLTPDGEYEMLPFINNTTKIRAVDGSMEVNVNTSGRMPTADPTGNLILWTVNDNRTVPGQTRPQSRVYVSAINGDNPREIFAMAGADAQWMNDDQILISARNERRETTLYTYTLSDASLVSLGQWREMRGLSVSPGGRYILFYLSWQDDPTENGIHMIDVQAPIPRKLDWFGAWRWRDNDTLYYIPFQPDQFYHMLRAIDLTSGEDTLLVSSNMAEFVIAEGHWEISADGLRVLFQSAIDRNLYILEPATS